MGVLSENPFTVANDIIEKVKDKVDIIIVDFHAEATAEKIALGYYLDGKANIIFGTHTHVQTADETILPKGTRIYNGYWDDWSKIFCNRNGCKMHLLKDLKHPYQKDIN